LFKIEIVHYVQQRTIKANSKTTENERKPCKT